jgi:hypothetical protein
MAYSHCNERIYFKTPENIRLLPSNNFRYNGTSKSCTYKNLK